jgi:transcriptional regulator with XRE-family HTH domain
MRHQYENGGHDPTLRVRAMSSSNKPQLGPMLRAERRRRHLSLRDLSEVIGVSVNTLSRVERGHLPDLRNYQRLVEWLEVPADTFLEQTSTEEYPPDTLDLVIRHLRSDTALTPAALEKLANVVREMYVEMTSSSQPRLAVHMRSAKMFTPAAATLLAEVLGEMQQSLQAEEIAD